MVLLVRDTLANYDEIVFCHLHLLSCTLPLLFVLECPRNKLYIERMNQQRNELTPIFPGWDSWTFRPFLPDHTTATWVLWATPDTAARWAFKDVIELPRCQLWSFHNPQNTYKYRTISRHSASILYTKTGCREFSQELRTVICLIMLLPADCQRTFLPSNILTINASNTSCKKQFLMKENLPGFRNRFSINCPAVCASLQADKKLLEVMISLFIQLKRKQTHLKSCSIVLSWENINEENTEIQDSFFLWLEVKIKQSKSKITVKTLELPFFWD